LVAPPALDRTGAHADTVVVVARDDRDHAALEAGDRDRCVALGGRRVADRPAAPALDAADAGEHAGVIPAGRDRNHAAESGNVGWRVALGRRPVAELTVAVEPPALDPTGGHHRARVLKTHRDSDH